MYILIRIKFHAEHVSNVRYGPPGPQIGETGKAKGI